MAVTQITEHRSKELVEALEELLARATRGHLHGLMFSIKTRSRRHQIGFAGDYWRDPIEALGIITRMEYKLNQLVSVRDDEPETRGMPL